MTEQMDTGTGEIVDSTPRGMPPEIIKARIAVMKEAHGVGKTGKNTFHNYDYASDFDVLSLVQPAMVKNGLALEMWPEDIHGPDDNGNMWVRFAMQWQHESGACADPRPWYGIAQDRDKQGRMGDKWFNKAATAAEKYFLLKQFHIPAGKSVDPDHGTTDGNPGFKGARRKKDDFSGKGVMKLKEQAREFNDAMEACATLPDFEDLIATTQKTLDQIKADIPNWWHSAPDSDVAGIEDRIMQRREQLRSRAEFEVPDAGTYEPMAPSEAWTDDGLLVVPQEDGVVLWDAWSKQFMIHELNKAADVDAVKALGEKYKATFTSLKMQDAALHKKMLDAAQARKAELGATAVAAE